MVCAAGHSSMARTLSCSAETLAEGAIHVPQRLASWAWRGSYRSPTATLGTETAERG